jgi:hypothetical protein
VEYLKFHGGDLLPLLLYIRYTIRIYPDHHPTTDLNTSGSDEVDTFSCLDHNISLWGCPIVVSVPSAGDHVEDPTAHL